MKLGVVCRLDQGGLAAQSWEVARHLQPDRILAVDLGDVWGRGPSDLTRLDSFAAEVFHYPRKESWGMEVERFLDGLDVAFAAESFYDDRVYAMARSMGVVTVVQLNPELFGDATRFADVLWNPSEWRMDVLPDRVEHVPFPVALDVLPYRRRTKAEVLFHPWAEAMLDRNGTRLVETACFHIDQPVKLYIRGGPEPNSWTWTAGKVACEWLPPVEHYYEVIPDEADLMLLPRRYGGLSLIVQEAAAKGIPTIMTDLLPQNRWFASDLLVRSPVELQGVGMKGGRIDVHTCDPKRLATIVNQLMRQPTRMARASDDVRTWAVARSWPKMLSEWRDRLEQAALLKSHQR